jgi:hypothetical protein
MIVNLNDRKREKQYRNFYQHGNLELARDTVYLHNKKQSNIAKTYTQSWIKLLSDNANKK